VTATASKPSGHEPAARLPAGDASGRLRLSGEPLLALTQDAQLLETLRKVGDPAHEVCPAGSEVELAAALLTHHAGVALLDCAAIASPLAPLAQRLRSQFPELALIVAGGIEEQTQLASQITDGTVHRFLHKPFSEQRVRLFVEAAWRRHAEMRAISATGVRSAASVPGSRPRRGWWAALLALAAVAVPFVWVGRHPPERASRGAPAPPPVKPVSSPHERRELDNLLARADQAQVRTAPERAVPDKAQRALAGGNLSAAPTVLNEATRGASRSLADEAREALAQSPADARVADYLDRARTALSRAQLIAPAEDNARLYIESARALAPNDERVAEAARDLIARLESEARQALTEKDPGAAESWIAAAADAGAEAEQVAALRQQAAALRAAASADAVQLARAAEGKRALDEAQAALGVGDLAGVEHWLAQARAAGADSAAVGAVENDLHAAESAARQAETYVNEDTLIRTRYVPPQFPQEAQLRGIEGWVELHFVVGTDGAVSELTVVAAQPTGFFERAALQAISQWRYQPVKRNGEPVSQRAQVRLRFKVRR